MKQLNIETSKFGIQFPLEEVQFGKSVNFLDVCIYVEENKSHYCRHTKPTDVKRYLNPSSFNPRSVFDSVPFSQMLRTVRNNSKNNTKIDELNENITHFVASGYHPNKLNDLKTKALHKSA